MGVTSPESGALAKVLATSEASIHVSRVVPDTAAGATHSFARP